MVTRGLRSFFKRYFVFAERNEFGELQLSGKKADLPFVAVGVLLGSFLVSFIAGSLIVHPQGSDAAGPERLGLVGASTMSLDTSSNSVDMEVTPTNDGSLVSGFHTLTASTNVPTGYNLSLATTGTPALTPSGGSLTAPVVLGNNTWGFALNQVSSSTAANTIINGFDASYATPVPSDTSKWANPSAGASIKRTTQTATDDAITIYYGAKADMFLEAGTYVNAVRYTATANVSNLPGVSLVSVTPSSGPTTGGTPIQIVGKGFTMNDQSITTAVTIGGIACENVSISSNVPTNGQDTIYCDAPANTAGAKDVTVTTWRGGVISSKPGYTYVVPADVVSVSPSIASTIAGAESGPQFTIVGSGFTGATAVSIGGISCGGFTVVSDTHIICRGATAGLTAGNKAVVVSNSGIDSDGAISVNYSSTAYPTLQSQAAFSSCSTAASIFRDERDSQLYYVKKMPDNKCWMVDNLKYAGFGHLSQESGKYLTADGTSAQSAINLDVAKYVDPGASSYCIGTDDKPTNTASNCGYLYNWYAATNGTGAYSQNTEGDQVTGSICPANFRLPTATSGGSSAASNGTSYNAADFPVLSASMNAGSPAVGATAIDYSAGWQPSGAWGGSFSGSWGNDFDGQGKVGYYWSSTTYSATNARFSYFYNSLVYPGNNYNTKLYGFAVRCVMDEPLPIDVYPTTGWARDTVTITGQGFSNVTSVTIGGMACSSYEVLSASKITCVLPNAGSGTSNNVAVVANGKNVTDANTYTHMKIMYYDSALSGGPYSINRDSYYFYPNGLTSSNCSSMNTAYINIFRDTRNNQMYRVKRMADGKCWMVDNLKYIDTAIVNASDSTVGMTLNNTSGKYNTIDGTNAPGRANIDKAFYNNPMFVSYCYGSSYLPSDSLTRCGYLYNWYAATAGTGAYALSTNGNQASASICPANFRLPSGSSDGSTATGNGTSYAAADFPVLSASMNAGSLTTGATTNSYSVGWQPSGAWGGSFSGYWLNGFANQGSSGYYWSSTVFSATNARGLRFYSSTVDPGNVSEYKYGGFAVRCVLP